MKEGAKILVAYDGSEHSKSAMREAVNLALKYEGSVTLLHVFWDPYVKKIEGAEIRDQATMKLMDEVEKELKKSKVKYEARSERSENVPKIILQVANEEGFDAIAIGSRGMGSAKAWMLGSVSSRVVAESPVPVIVVK